MSEREAWSLTGAPDMAFCMFHVLKEYFPKAAFCYHDSIADIKAAIDQMYGDTDDEYFVNINVFRDYYNDEAEYIVSREAA